MTELIVVGFEDKQRANQVLNELRGLDADWIVEMDDAVAVHKDSNGKLKLDQRFDLEGEGAGWGALWGGLIGSLLAVPLTGGMSAGAGVAAVAAGGLGGTALGAMTGAADGTFRQEEFGLDEEFVRDVGTALEPDNSAIFVWIRVADPVIVAADLEKYGGTLIRTTLTPAQDAKLQSILDAGK